MTLRFPRVNDRIYLDHAASALCARAQRKRGIVRKNRLATPPAGTRTEFCPESSLRIPEK